jgi:hypothetical protein
VALRTVGPSGRISPGSNPHLSGPCDMCQKGRSFRGLAAYGLIQLSKEPAVSGRALPVAAIRALIESPDPRRGGVRRRLCAAAPQWAADGRSVLYVSMPTGAPALVKRAAADGPGLLEELGPGNEAAMSGDGRLLLYSRDFNVFDRPFGGGEVDVQSESRLRVGVPRRLFGLTPIAASGVLPGFDVSETASASSSSSRTPHNSRHASSSC